jgi:2-oxoglutarate ferredoxin oxidoreductase subunit alpha
MIALREEKVARIASELPPIEVTGDDRGDLLVVGWGGTHGAIASAVESARADGHAVSAIHLRHLNPFPPNLGEVLGRFDQVLVPELNAGQLAMLLRAKFLIDAKSLSKIQGQPFKVQEIRARIGELLRPREA